MDERRLLHFKNEAGEDQTVKVYDIFELKKYPGKQYISFSFNLDEDADDDNVCISILDETDDSFTLKTIEDEAEWLEVKSAFDESETVGE